MTAFNQKLLIQFLFGFDKAKHAKMLGIYIDSFQNHFNICHKAIQDKDPALLLSSVHDVKSLYYTLEAVESGNLAEKIEDALKEEKYDEAFKDAANLLVALQSTLDISQAYAEELAQES